MMDKTSLCSLLLLVLRCAACTAQQEPLSRQRGGRQLAQLPSSLTATSTPVLLVSLQDGRVVGLDAANGRILWQFDSGASYIFPGVDGGLYAFNGLDGTQARPAVGGGMPPCASLACAHA